MLCEITGMDAMTLQPAAGAHGEFTGLLLIKAYHRAMGHNQRTKILVPDSAHGTNPASASMAGFEVVSIASDANGCVDLEALKAAAGEDTAGLMLTNPNTVGLFDPQILEITRIPERFRQSTLEGAAPRQAHFPPHQFLHRILRLHPRPAHTAPTGRAGYRHFHSQRIAQGNGVAEGVLPVVVHVNEAVLHDRRHPDSRIEMVKAAYSDAVHPEQVLADAVLGNIPVHPMPPQIWPGCTRRLLEFVL
jgi:hypothetical protein